MATQKSTTFHPALVVSNIKTHISITLEMENVQYATWAELFKIHCRSHRVIQHIILPKTPTPPNTEPPATTTPNQPVATAPPTQPTDEDSELWSTLDATVLQWIYATISPDLLHTILEPDSTAMEAWNRLRDIFQDNKHSRAVTLEQEFSSTKMADFSNASAYCQRLKVLSDQLKNVGSPVTNNRLVLQMVAGLTEAYKGVGTLIRQSNPLPAFYQARSMLILEEAGIAKQVTVASDSALLTVSSKQSDASSYSNQQQHTGPRNYYSRPTTGRNTQPRGGGRSGHRFRRQNGSSGGRRHNHGSLSWQPQPTWPRGPSSSYYPWNNYPTPWTVPPCPFPSAQCVGPTSSYSRPTTPNSGLLGPKPQAYTATASPTDIEAAMHTLGISPPDANWYMDTGATSHMTSNQGFSHGDALNEM